MGKISISPTFKFAIPNQGKFTSHEIMKFPTNMCLIRAQQISTASSTSCTKIPAMEDILESSRAQKLDLNLQKLGPFFRITATNSETKTELGRVEGLIRVWLDGKILHLDSIRLKKETTTMKRSIFGVGVFLGAVAIRHGFDSGCDVAQLLAINDTDLYHSKLVRFYSRIGFKAVHEVDGSSIGDLSHMLVWGGRGTRMNANIDDLLVKWCTRFNPKG